jgi:hypothetical protein
MTTNPPSIGQVFKRPSVKDVKAIFPSANAVGIILPEVGRGLHIGFNHLVDFGKELKIAVPSAKVRHEPLFELVKAFGFVVLKNCSAQTIPDEGASSLSHGQDSDGKFIQDPYHYDVFQPKQDQEDHVEPADNHLYMSGIYKKSAEAREEDTFYAIETDVKEAIAKLDMDDLPDDVRDALAQMMRGDYHFRLYHPDEHEARNIVKKQYPGFVDDVFNLIPERRKYRQTWLKGQWDILLLSNVFGDGLHARPTGHMMTSIEVPANPLRGLYLFKE